MTGIIAKNSEVKRIIKKLKAGDLTVNSVPKELSRNIDTVSYTHLTLPTT